MRSSSSTQVKDGNSCSSTSWKAKVSPLPGSLPFRLSGLSYCFTLNSKCRDAISALQRGLLQKCKILAGTLRCIALRALSAWKTDGNTTE
eukprot:1004770-Amphidinium_carterae.2